MNMNDMKKAVFDASNKRKRVHRTPQKECVVSNCKEKASRKWCSEHSVAQTCRQNDCIRKPFFNVLGTGAQWCKAHKTPEMVDVNSKKCIGCHVKRPNFGLPMDTKATYCSSCALDGMIDISNRKCKSCKKKQPNFGLPSDFTATYCSSCALDGMVDINTKKCISCGLKHPVFGLPDDKVATYCGDCKMTGMYNIKSKKCSGCNNKQPTFGHADDDRATYCAECRLPGMINITSRLCSSCKIKHPSFGLPGDKVASYCADCKLKDMKNIKSRKCIGCNDKQPSFGFLNDDRATCCRDCKVPDMVDIRSRMCTECTIKRPQFGYADDVTATHCGGCRMTGMVNIRDARCETLDCAVYEKHERGYVSYKIDGTRMCPPCCQRLYPEVAKRGLQMRTELLVIAEIERLVPELSNAIQVIWDCPPNCDTRLSPDRVWFFEIDGKIVTLHLEVDESGKRHEDNEGRVAMIQGSMLADMSWLIRFNPGRSSDGRPPCVILKKEVDGTRKYEKAKGNEWDHRMTVLADLVRDVCRKIDMREEPTIENWKQKLFF